STATASTQIYTLSLHDALPISHWGQSGRDRRCARSRAGPPHCIRVSRWHDRRNLPPRCRPAVPAHRRLPDLETGFLRLAFARTRSEEHTSELQSLRHLVCRLLL